MGPVLFNFFIKKIDGKLPSFFFFFSITLVNIVVLIYYATTDEAMLKLTLAIIDKHFESALKKKKFALYGWLPVKNHLELEVLPMYFFN